MLIKRCTIPIIAPQQISVPIVALHSPARTTGAAEGAIGGVMRGGFAGRTAHALASCVRVAPVPPHPPPGPTQPPPHPGRKLLLAFGCPGVHLDMAKALSGSPNVDRQVEVHALQLAIPSAGDLMAVWRAAHVSSSLAVPVTATA